MTCFCLSKFYPSVLMLCHLLHTAYSDFSALSPVPLSEAPATLSLQLSLDLSTSVLWGSWVFMALSSFSKLRPKCDSALCPQCPAQARCQTVLCSATSILCPPWCLICITGPWLSKLGSAIPWWPCDVTSGLWLLLSEMVVTVPDRPWGAGRANCTSGL